ncbi:hypothetical protein B8W66_11555 [Mycobacterium decipiens]|uniref:Uncharacterized protein n=1 Tax=Mycobacterium decipiens TaxID=1430326 RepID=A0A1X2LW98_9MYCO|nr:hypothetical protein B8W66_11555 [Mycobacterium decipiens]
MDMNGRAATTGRVARAATADRHQAEYFLHLLTQIYRQIDLQEQERQVLDGLIDQLHRRFPLRALGAVSPISRRALVAVK